MQLWPANENACWASFDAVSSRSASASTRTGVELPSSSVTFLRAARPRSSQPTPLEPVNVIMRTRSSSTSTSPISEAGPTRTFSQPAREPGLLLSSARRRAESGVWLAGFEDDRAPGREGGGDLVRDEVEREVERADRADDADRHRAA